MSAHSGPPEGVAKFLISGMVVLFLAYLYEVQDVSEYIGAIHPNLPVEVSNTVGVYYNVTKVTDGDTIHIEMDGRDEKVRLIGINTPETVDPRREVQCFGKEASARMKELAGGNIVRLEYDDTQSVRDAYNRLLAYVYLEDGQMLNRKMVAEGYAYEYTYLTPYKYQKEFREIQLLAKASSRGLWAENTCKGSTFFNN